MHSKLNDFFYYMNLSSVKPENVKLETSADGNKACRGDAISINCSADAVPSEISYQLLENNTAILDASGMWNRLLTTAGVVNYQCVANNTVGTGDNANVTVTVNGKGNAKNEKMLSSRVYRKWRHSVIQFTSSVVQYIVAPHLSFHWLKLYAQHVFWHVYFPACTVHVGIYFWFCYLNVYKAAA